MSDELSALAPDEPRKTIPRVRTTSLDVRQTYSSSPSNSNTRADSPLRRRGSANYAPDGQRLFPDIIAPTPRRHLVDSSASQLWLRTPPPVSPVSSRATSPISTTSRTFSRSQRHSSFSSLVPPGQAFNPNLIPRPGSAKSSKGSGHEKDLHGKGAADGDTGAGRRWIKWMHKRGLKHLVVPGAIVASVLVKWCVGLGSYSGKGVPPMYGDYEAQRHWMELTVHLPFRQWYTYDLQYWGLDYPPLTAYVSWLCGRIGSWIEPSWFLLDKSRGIETEGSKVFMRSTVIITDLLVYIPALLMFVKTWQRSRSKRTQEIALFTLLFQPALLLIDNGHFQYNSVMLGFTLLAMNYFSAGQDFFGAFFFVLSLGFKQMSLYYAPAIGSYLLAKCIYLGPLHGFTHLIRLGVITLGTFILLFLPFLPPFAATSAILDPITRIFPFARGLFEDKVANFWCASNVVLKWKRWASPGALIKLSTALTAAGFLPSVVMLLRAGFKFQGSATSGSEETKDASAKKAESPAAKAAPFLPLLPYALLTSSMSFFLFSFQVHEKTILVPLLPLTLLQSGAPVHSSVFLWGSLVNNTAVFSMWSLLNRDGLGLQYLALLVLWNRVIGYNPFRTTGWHFIMAMATYPSFIAIHVLEMILPPPARYPDLYPVLNVLVSTPVFVLTWLWSIKCGIEVTWALGGLPGTSTGSVKSDVIHRQASGDSTSSEAVVSGFDRQSGKRYPSLGYSQSSRQRTGIVPAVVAEAAEEGR